MHKLLTLKKKPSKILNGINKIIMQTFIITEQERKDILQMYDQLNEGGIDPLIKKIGNFGRNTIRSSEDDIINIFKSQTGKAIVSDIDNIVASATRNKNISELENLEKQVYHMLNSGRGEYQDVSVELKKLLNAYAKSKGKSSWGAIRDEVTGTPKVNPAGTQAGGAVVGAKSWAGHELSSESTFRSAVFAGKTNYNTREEFSNVMSNEIERILRKITTLENGWNTISASGFEKYGIKNMRDWLRKNVEKIEYLDKNNRIWRIKIKDNVVDA